MAGLVERVVREYARPLLVARGYQAGHGRRYRQVGEDGTLRIVTFRRQDAVAPAEIFRVILAVVVPMRQRRLEHCRGVPHDITMFDEDDGTVSRGVAAPHEFDSNPGSPLSGWVVHEVEYPVAECGEALVQSLRDDALPWLEHLGDRRRLLEDVRSHTNNPRVDLVLQLLTEDGPSPELEAAIEETRRRNTLHVEADTDEASEWYRAQMLAHTPNK